MIDYFTVEGICQGIPAGNVTITVNNGVCEGSPIRHGCYLGWQGALQIFMAESFIERTISYH